ncbi:cytochrome b-c1 complex subunit 6, mitochondrial-like [Battus philenor]|uniref:cytochrome b-c1 complex subunit 6, mitochondrial-like n=1 Tax=Battus philenor TaxID=42288 RepID=UPI0035D07C34
MTDEYMFDPNSADQLTKERGDCLQYDCGIKKIYEQFQRCENRVKGKSYTAETCEEELIDLMVALDHCVAEKAFKKFV